MPRHFSKYHCELYETFKVTGAWIAVVYDC